MVFIFSILGVHESIQNYPCIFMYYWNIFCLFLKAIQSLLTYLETEGVGRSIVWVYVQAHLELISEILRPSPVAQNSCKLA